MITCIYCTNCTQHTFAVMLGNKIMVNVIEFQTKNYIFILIYKAVNHVVLNFCNSFYVLHIEVTSFSSMSTSACLFLSIYLSAHKVPTESYLSQLSWQDSPLYSEMQPEKRLSQPEPPSPAPGQQPLQIRDLWEQYLDPTTQRYYYVNSITKERSWKPPRRALGHNTGKVKHVTQHVSLFYFSSLTSFAFAEIEIETVGIFRAG